MRSKGTSTSSKKTSENSGTPCIASSGRTAIPGLSMSTKSAVIPRWADSGVPVRTRSTQRCANWAKLVHTFCPLTSQPSSVRVARQARDAEVAPGARLGEALAPGLVAPQQARHHLGRQVGEA